MKVTRLKHKGTGKERFVSEVLFTSKGAEYWKSEGYEIDPKPYIREVTPKGVKYELDAESWQSELEAHERAEGGEVTEAEIIEAPKKKTRQKRNPATAEDGE